MEFDVFWLLSLPLFFALGWLAARHESRSRPMRATLPDAYFRGLNFLLNDQSDRAVDAFVDVVRIDPETVELHFALGKLFRRRGETDRAIRVHQNLLDRSDIDSSLREQALYELAQDFLKAGLLDRADRAFERLAAGTYAAQALRHRIEIAETMRDWVRAIDLSVAMATADRQEADCVRLAHFHCELAAQSIAEGSAEAYELAQHRIRQAEQALALGPSSPRQHPRILALRGDIAWSQSRDAEAIEAWSELLAVAPDHFNLVVLRWVDAHRRSGKLTQALDTLQMQWERRPSAELFLQLFNARTGDEPARDIGEWAVSALARSASLAGLARLLAWRMEGAPQECSEELRLAQKLLAEQAAQQSRHLCSNCGFRARQYYWQCPGCAKWDSISPLRAEDSKRP
jgi:lipopolysaccharide biosynthesis regulator YciM